MPISSGIVFDLFPHLTKDVYTIHLYCDLVDVFLLSDRLRALLNMIISRLSQYAIQSLIYMGLQKKGEPILCKEIAEELGVPKAYLSMIMNSLRKAGIVSSNYGRCGGYSLEKDPYQVNLMQILLITEGINFTTQCLMGLKLCGKNGFCPMHEKWMPVKAELISMFEEQNVASLADAVRDGRYHLTDLPRVLYTN